MHGMFLHFCVFARTRSPPQRQSAEQRNHQYKPPHSGKPQVTIGRYEQFRTGPRLNQRSGQQASNEATNHHSRRNTFLVTGGAGFIGANFVHWVARNHPQAHMTVLDALTYAGKRENLDGVPAANLTFVHGNICDAELVESLFSARTNALQPQYPRLTPLCTSPPNRITIIRFSTPPHSSIRT